MATALTGKHERTGGIETDIYSVVDAIPGLVCIMSPTGEVEHPNRQVLEYFGKASEELKNWAFTDAVHPDDLPHAIATFSNSVATGTPYDIEHRCRRADGIYRWFHVRAQPLRNSDNLITGWFVLLIDIDDRKCAEETVRASERNFKQIVNTIPAMAWAARPDGSAEFFNQHYLDYVGLSAEQSKDWGWTIAVHPDDMNGLAAAWQLIIASEKSGESEARLRHFDGEYRWFLFRVNPLRNEQGKIVKWYGTNIDIEDRKRADQALRANERDLNHIINTIPVLAWCNLPDGSNEFLNQPWHDFTGLSPDQAHGWGWQVAIHPHDLLGLLDLWRSLLASGEPGEIEARLRRFDGEYRWFLFRVNPLRDERGSIVKWYGTNTDIDDRKRAEEKLRRNEAFLAEAQRLSLTGSFSWNVATDETSWSEEVYRIFEYDRAAPLTIELIYARFHPEDIALLEEVRARARSGVDFEYRHRLLMPDRSVKYLHVVAHGTKCRNGETHYVGAVQDVTQQRLSEEALGKLRSDLAHVARVMSLGALTASIAHEVNQPLSGIVTNASTCLRMLDVDPPNLDGARETARRTIRDGHRASDVIKKLRTLFSRKDTTIESVDLNEATREVIALALGELQRNCVIVRTELADGLPPVAGDRVQLQQIILNLILNASDAMSEIEDRARQLVVKTESEELENSVRLSIKDAGIGFDPEAANRLFDSFYTTKNGGMGVGLAVSRSIIESHNGRIWATLNDGPGATFSFSISRDSVMEDTDFNSAKTPVTTDAKRVSERNT